MTCNFWVPDLHHYSPNYWVATCKSAGRWEATRPWPLQLQVLHDKAHRRCLSLGKDDIVSCFCCVDSVVGQCVQRQSGVFECCGISEFPLSLKSPAQNVQWLLLLSTCMSFTEDNPAKTGVVGRTDDKSYRSDCDRIQVACQLLGLGLDDKQQGATV